MAPTGMVNYRSVFEKWDDCKRLFQRNTVTLKKLDHGNLFPGIMSAPLKGMAAIHLKQKRLSSTL